MANRRFGYRSGNVHARNIQTGRATVTLDGSGDGDTSVTFKHAFDSTPSIIMTPESDTAITTGVFQVSSADTSGFVMHVDGCSITTDDITMNWAAVRNTE
jgi:hypothetical protein